MASVILAAWVGSLVWLLASEHAWSWSTAPAVLLRTWLSTGLFIVAHDAMHGTVHPVRPLNDAVGRLALLTYALLPYDRIRRMHHRHHAHPGVAGEDPDFHDGVRPGALSWYLLFLRRYVSWGPVLGMALVFNVLHHGLGISQTRLWLYWVGPALLSTVQLFVVGTWLPHREPHAEGDPHRARSLALPRPLSLLACYHFGYHREHHEAPWVPWWRLRHQPSGVPSPR